MNTTVVVCIVFLAVIGAFVAFWFMFLNLWVRALLAGARVPLVHLLGMQLRGTKPRVIVDAYLAARKGGVDVSVDELETHALARGNVSRLVAALSAAAGAGIPLSFRDAAAIDLAGRDVVEEVRGCLTPRTLHCPDPFEPDKTFDVVSADGTALTAKAVLSVRPRLHAGGRAGDGVLVERVEKGIRKAVAAAAGQSIRYEPGAIGQAVRRMQLDLDTALEIVALEVTLEETREGWRF